MNRRSFLKVLSAIGAGVALRPLPVLGEQFSVLEAPVSVAVPPMDSGASLVNYIMEKYRSHSYPSVSDVPDGWLVCDGTHGTPDLRIHVHSRPSHSHPSLMHSQKLSIALGSHQHSTPYDV